MSATETNTVEPARLLSPTPSRGTRRFTLDGDERLEAHIAAICSGALDGLQRIIPRQRLDALLLGGGYGRGEGGVLTRADGDHPYNDLEFYVFLRGHPVLNRRRFGQKLFSLAHAMSPVAGVDVEFHIISFAQLRRSRPSMFFYDLIAGHHRLRGGDQPFGNCDQHRHARNLPLAEATRLLMNRGTGLLLSREKLNHTVLRAEDADFVARNVAKAELALGDAVLTALGQYHWSCLERRRRLPVLSLPGGMPWFDELCHHHAVGVEFKLHPQKSVAPVEVLRRDLEEVADLMLRVWLWLEATRLGQRFSSAREYVAATVNKCPETSPWRNRLLNAWIFGPGSFVSRKSHRHPRERILNALAILLWDRDDPGNYLARALRGPFNRPATRAELLEGYRRIWEHVR